MKNLLKTTIPALAIMLGVASCDKTTTTTTPTPTTPTPTTPTAPTPVTPTVGGNFWGVMVALKMEFSYNVTGAPFPVSLDYDMAVANFYNGAGSSTVVDAGTVSVNSNNLEKQTNNSYYKSATTGMTPSSLGYSSGVQWQVAGGNGIPSINYTHTGSFPEYSGTLPSEINRSQDLEIDLGSKVTGADSVYVVIITSSKQIIKAYDGNPAPAKATITASELGSLPAVSDNSAYLEVVPFTYAMPIISGKQFVAIKETAAVASVKIN
ncbi:MAG: hypothetical protein H3C54_07350 [Taibaiella sp.]|nr:hypothetical protein [Taibaiella sp.]